jgi:alkyl hydroperoxide reductase subunit AhpF
MEKLLNDQVIGQIKQAFADLTNPVQLLFFGSKENCDYCAETQQLLSELSEIDAKVSLSTHDLNDDAALAAQYNVDKVPAIIVAAKDGEQASNLGINFSGIPSGYEFSTLINDIILASKRESGLSAATREFLQKLTQPLLLQVFVTPT